MAAITASDLTIVVTERWIEGKKRYSRGTITMPGTLTYTTGGIPLNGPTAALTPAAQKRLGLDRQLDVFVINGDYTTPTMGTDSTTGFDYKLGVTKSLALYETGAATTSALKEAPATTVPGRRTLKFYAVGW